MKVKKYFNQKIEINYTANTHIPQLDGIRGLAIFLVLGFHCFPFLAPARLGWLGVDLFFVLSGFLITGVLWDTKSHPNYYKNFLARRMLRIFPLYYVFLIFYFLVLPFIAQVPIHNFSEVQSWFWLYITNWLFVFRFQDWIAGVDINHFWSLAIEEQFYVFWPLVIYFFSRKNIFKIIVVTVCVSILSRFCFLYMGYAPITSYVSTISRVDGLVIGAAVALMVRDDTMKEWLQKHVFKINLISILAILLVIVVGRSTSPYSIPFLTIGFTVNTLFFATIILFSLSDVAFGSIKKVGMSPLMRFLGKYSYALYVFHLPVYSYFHATWYQLLLSQTGNQLVSKFLSSVGVVLVTVVLSLLTWLLLEKPFLRLKKYFLY